MAASTDTENPCRGTRTNASIIGEEQNWTSSITGTSPEYFELRSWPMTLGAPFTQADVDGGAKVVVLGQTVVDKLYGPATNPVGQTVRIRNVPFVVVGVAFWQYGGTLALIPALTADYFGSKNLGLNYGLVFLGWGAAFLVPQAAGYIQTETGSLDAAFYLSAGLLAAAVVLSRFLKRPTG